MAAFTDAAARFGSAGTSSNGTADEAAQRLLPSPGGDVEMSAVAADAFGGGGAARRRATVLKRLESLDPAIRGKIDNQQLVDLVDDVVVAETGRRTLRFSTLLMMLFAAVLLVGIFAMTWAVVRGLHARIDRLSEHVTAHSIVQGGFPTGRPSVVLERVSRYVRQKPLGAGKGDEQNHHHYHFGAQAMVGEPGTTSDSAAALLYPIDYMHVYSGASVARDQLAAICASVEKGELQFVVHFKDGVMVGGWPADNISGPLERPHELSKPLHLGRTMATITDAALCDDPARKAGAIAFGFMVQQATSSAYPFIQAKITCAPGDEAAGCPFEGESIIETAAGFQCGQKPEGGADQSNVWTCPHLTWQPYTNEKLSEPELRKLCGATGGTCGRNVTLPTSGTSGVRDWGPPSGIDLLIKPTDSCVLFNATSLQCLHCKPSCATACKHADAPPVDVCKSKPETTGCDTCTIDAACGQQQCGERCIPAHAKVTVRSQAADPEGFSRFRPCCNSTGGVPWTLQADAGAPHGEKRCYPA